jgi:DNA-binding response OmpR family regulator
MIAGKMSTFRAMEQKRRRVAVIDDEESIRRMLEVALALEGFEVRAAADGVAGLSLIRSWEPECIVLDIMLPKVDGLTLVPMIRRLTEVPIIMLTARGEVRDRIDGIRAGADDYLPKPFDVEELATRLHAALRRPRLLEVHTLHYEDLEIDLEARTVRRESGFLSLSAREFDLLTTLARRPRRVFTREELIHMVWGDERDTSTQTVETYISYLRQKIDLPSLRALIHTVRGVGYVLR